jgi:multiple sugar transport system substrate-binding protein
MIIWSPFILDELAGLRDSAPPTINDDPTSSRTGQRTGIVTNFAGPSNPDGAAWADIRYFGVTADADTDAAMEFVEYLDVRRLHRRRWPSRPRASSRCAAVTARTRPPSPRPGRRSTSASTARAAGRSLRRRDDRRDRRRSRRGAALGRGRWAAGAGLQMINSQVINRFVRQYIDGVRGAEETVQLMNEELGAIE